MKSTKRKGIRINGEGVADLDFASMFTRLGYAEVGAAPPAGDLYALPALEGQTSWLDHVLQYSLKRDVQDSKLAGDAPLDAFAPGLASTNKGIKAGLTLSPKCKDQMCDLTITSMHTRKVSGSLAPSTC